MKNINLEIAKDILNEMPQHKKEVLKKALDRNEILTSSRVLEHGVITIYKEGWLLKLEGTRCSFSVFAKDNDGNFEFIRKPRESKLHKLYTEGLRFSESDFK
jgi:hypothetical protein